MLLSGQYPRQANIGFGAEISLSCENIFRSDFCESGLAVELSINPDLGADRLENLPCVGFTFTFAGPFLIPFEMETVRNVEKFRATSRARVRHNRASRLFFLPLVLFRTTFARLCSHSNYIHRWCLRGLWCI